MKKKSLIFFLIIIFFCLVLLISGTRILIYENKKFIIDPFENNKKSILYLECTYFTGRNFTLIEYHYSKNNIMGRDSCPFIYKDKL